MRFIAGLRSIVAAMVMVAIAADTLGAPQYDIISIGVAQPGDTTSSGLGVSPNGTWASGFSSGSGANRALIWSQATGTVGLPSLPERAFSVATSVNNAGVAAGTAANTVTGANPLPVLWNNGAVSQLPLPAGTTRGGVNGINLSETAVGSAIGGTSERAAIFTVGGSQLIPQTLPNGGALVTAYAINDAGRIVGYGLDPNNSPATKGWYLDPGASAPADIGVLIGLGHNSAISFGVSSNGMITGSSSLNGTGAQPFIWSESGGMAQIPTPAGTTTGEGRGVNADGWVVGNSSAGTSVPFLFDGTESHRLHDLIAVGTGWDLMSGTSNAAFGIGDNGVITGRGLLNGVMTGFVMVPIPEPTALGMTTLALPALLRRRR